MTGLCRLLGIKSYVVLELVNADVMGPTDIMLSKFIFVVTFVDAFAGMVLHLTNVVLKDEGQPQQQFYQYVIFAEYFTL